MERLQQLSGQLAPTKKTMRAAQYDKENKKVVINDVPIPEVGEGQILVKIGAASLCHSDLMIELRPDNFGRPITMGHEACGYVAQLHPTAENKGLKVGDKIGMLYGVDCCFNCEGCQSHCLWCTSPRRGGAKLKGLQADGYFAEYATTDWQNAIILPDSLPMDKISPLFCAGLTAFHSVDKCELEPGQWIAVVGCGGLGQFACRYAKAMGFKVVGLDINDDMLELVKQSGADVVINTKTTPKFGSQLRKTTGGGCHAAAVFSAALPAYATARSALRVNGVLMVVGLPDKPLSFPAFGLSGNLFRVKGANTGTPMEMKKGVDFTAKHQILPEVVYRKLEEMPQMCKELDEGKASKRMVVLFK